MVDGVPDDFRFDDAGVGDEIAVGAPGGGTVGAGIVGDAQQCRAGVGAVRGDDPDIGVVVGVRLFRAVADKGDQATVGAPNRIRIVIVAGRDLHGLRFPGWIDVLHVQVGAAAVEIAGIVAFELQAVDHPGLFFRVFAFGLFFRIANHQHQPVALGRPGVIGNALLDVGERIGFAAAPIQRPDLGFAFVPRGEEGQVAAVGAPLRIVRRGTRAGHRQDGIVAGGSHPDARFGAVLFQAGGAYRVGDPAAIGTDCRIGHGFEREQVFRLEQAGLLGHCAHCRKGQCASDQASRPEIGTTHCKLLN